jgi:hypothetical protein
MMLGQIFPDYKKVAFFMAHHHLTPGIVCVSLQVVKDRLVRLRHPVDAVLHGTVPWGNHSAQDDADEFFQCFIALISDPSLDFLYRSWLH